MQRNRQMVVILMLVVLFATFFYLEEKEQQKTTKVVVTGNSVKSVETATKLSLPNPQQTEEVPKNLAVQEEKDIVKKVLTSEGETRVPPTVEPKEEVTSSPTKVHEKSPSLGETKPSLKVEVKKEIESPPSQGREPKPVKSLDAAKSSPTKEKPPKNCVQYVVKKKDNSWAIAREAYNIEDKEKLKQIRKIILSLNPALQLNPDQLQINQVIWLPQKVEVLEQKKVESIQIKEDMLKKVYAFYHRIKRGETLSSIAYTHYKDKGKWLKIFDANPGINPDRLVCGDYLAIPIHQGEQRP
jgi:nucleoid-associated protein YgaU